MASGACSSASMPANGASTPGTASNKHVLQDDGRILRVGTHDSAHVERLVQDLRTKLIDRVVKDGQSWAKARNGYLLLLSRHVGNLSIAANYLGGAHVNRDRRGDRVPDKL